MVERYGVAHAVQLVHLGQQKAFLKRYKHKPVAHAVALNHTVAQDVQHD